MSRKGLDIGSLDDFQPRNQPAPEAKKLKTPLSLSEGWSRREAPQEGQFTIRAKLDTIERFKQMCRPEGEGRFTYGEMLERLMDHMDGQN